ncbi:MAG TPA: 4Fe-4S double cluster binding domain-containing protein [Methanosarcina sp.]|nr:4Fe-4S double cluster binding domain-containing protein [Methanosarcina sp.]
MSNINLSISVKNKALELGYDLCGITSVDLMEEYASQLDERIRSFPESRELYEGLYPMAFPKKNVEWAKSVVVCVRRYGKYSIPEGLDEYIGKAYLVDGRLKHSKEYSIKNEFETYLNALGLKTAYSIVPARLAAVSAGLGRFGRNNFFYTEKYGSWVFIDTWVIDSEMEYDEPTNSLNCPEGCNKCIDSCPTGALNKPLSMNRGKCIAQLTNGIDLQTEELRTKMGTWIYGCDVCQNVCPKNKNRWEEKEDFAGLSDVTQYLSLESIWKMDEKTFLEIVQPRFWYIGQDGLWIWKCNALRAMANSEDKKYHKYIKEAVKDPDHNIRNMALWACQKLGI